MWFVPHPGGGVVPALAVVDFVKAVPAAGIGDADLSVFGLAFERWGTALAHEGCVFGMSLLCPHRWMLANDGFGVSP